MDRKRSRGRSGRRRNKQASVGRPKRKPVMDIPWTEHEEKLLYERIEDPDENKCWEDIIERIQKEIPTFNHNPEDCMKHYKCYVNPSWYKENWPMDQGFFLGLFAKVYGFNWEKLAILLQEKDPYNLKNYFYSYMHKAIRHASTNYIPWSVLDKPANLFEWIQMLDEIENRCFKASLGENGTKVSEWIKKTQLDAKKLSEYRNAVIRKFREAQGEEKLPIDLMIDLDKINIKGSEAQTLVKAEESISAGIKDLVNIRFETTEVEKKSHIEGRCFKFPYYRSMLPIYIIKQQLPEPIIYPNVPSYTSQIAFQPQVQAGIMIPPAQERSFDHQRKNNPSDNVIRRDPFK